MQNVNLRKTGTNHATPKEQERQETIPEVAVEQELPPFVARLARERHVKIAKEQTIPKHRHD